MLNLKPVQATLVLGQPGLHRMTWRVGWGPGEGGKGGQEGRVHRVCAEMAKTKSKLTNKIPQDDV